MASYFYKDKPLFGLDIGFSSIKVMQISGEPKKEEVTGYGVNDFDPAAVKDGVIADYESLAKAAKQLFDQKIIGEITSRRVAVAVPAARSFARNIILPKLSAKDLAEAVRLEAEQYIPVPIDELYIDYAIGSQTDKETNLVAVAIPKKIVDSYMLFLQLLGLEPVLFETTITSASRLFIYGEQANIPTILIDFGSLSVDITIYDRGLAVSGTVTGGGDNFTALIAEHLGISKEEANDIKTKYGLGVSKKQKAVETALSPLLQQLVKEVRRMIRYYEERSGSKNKISQIVTMGGGANMPGLSEYLINALRLPVRLSTPWEYLNFAGLQPPPTIEKSLYVTVSGLALIKPKEIFR